MQLPGGDPLAPSSITGYTWTAEAQMSDGKSLVIVVGVPASTSADTWRTVFSVVGGSCDGAFGEATLSGQ
jgi:hypothetical protein